MKTDLRRARLLLVLFVLGVVPLAVSKAQQTQPDQQPQEPPMVVATENELLQFWGWVMDHVEAGTEGSKYLSPQTNKRLVWMVDKLQKKELSFALATGRIPSTEKIHALMVADYEAGKPIVRVNLSLLAVWYWGNYKSKIPISRQERNNLTVALSHEIIHLQHGSLVLQAVKSDAPLHDFEERRTWATSVIEDIRPLVEQREPLRDDFVLADKALRSCQDDQDCPAFKKFLYEHTIK